MRTRFVDLYPRWEKEPVGVGSSPGDCVGRMKSNANSVWHPVWVFSLKSGMTINDFEYMEVLEKTEVLSTDGIYLARRTDGPFSILLYQLDGFYVELYYNAQQNCLTCIRSFDSVGELAYYLEDVDISDLFSESGTY
jgi:hypothetical protein